jgi:hypothetical protein
MEDTNNACPDEKEGAEDAVDAHLRNTGVSPAAAKQRAVFPETPFELT